MLYVLQIPHSGQVKLSDFPDKEHLMFEVHRAGYECNKLHAVNGEVFFCDGGDYYEELDDMELEAQDLLQKTGYCYMFSRGGNDEEYSDTITEDEELIRSCYSDNYRTIITENFSEILEYRGHKAGQLLKLLKEEYPEQLAAYLDSDEE